MPWNLPRRRSPHAPPFRPRTYQVYLLPTYTEAEANHVGPVGVQRRLFNTVHNPPRRCIERAYGVLKGRCRSLLCLDMKHDRFTPHIKACVALHNILIDHQEDFDEALVVGYEGDDEGGLGGGGGGGGAAAAGAGGGESVRRALSARFAAEGR